MEYVLLHGQVKMPIVGFGTMPLKGQEGVELFKMAVQCGYRMFDSASIYGNEDIIAQGIKKCGVDRSELFIVSKLWFDCNSYKKAKEGFYQTLKNLDLEYIDLYLIHYPFGDYMGAWKALEELYEEGLIRAIGVSNFFNDQLLNLMTFSKIKPSINQIQCSPFLHRNPEREFLNKHQIIMEAWQSFAQGKNGIFSNEVLTEIAQKYNKSVSQIILRWQTQNNIVVIPSSHSKERMMQNLDIFDFYLDQDDIQKIQTLNTKEELGNDAYRIHMLEKFL